MTILTAIMNVFSVGTFIHSCKSWCLEVWGKSYNTVVFLGFFPPNAQGSLIGTVYELYTWSRKSKLEPQNSQLNIQRKPIVNSPIQITNVIFSLIPPKIGFVSILTFPAYFSAKCNILCSNLSGYSVQNILFCEKTEVWVMRTSSISNAGLH